ncbi:MAG: hypothetical protein L3J61_01755 [Ghiorsea sp.]|nr:hypothetical protein [Ghiorsea sp.]
MADRIVTAKHTKEGVEVAMGEAVIETITEDYTDVLIGNPHRVYFNHAQACPERNVEIISDYDENQVNIRIIERGAGETLACGSGACATAAAVWQRLGRIVPLIIHMPGGQVYVHKHGTQVFLTGVVTYVFDGHYTCV